MNGRGEWIDQAQIDPLSRLDAKLFAKFSPGGDGRWFVFVNAAANHFNTLPFEGVFVFASQVRLGQVVQGEHGYARLHPDCGEGSRLSIRPDDLIFADFEPGVLVFLNTFLDQPRTFYS